MTELDAGYREIEHTADWELEVWAPDLPGFLEHAARGMYMLAAIRLIHEPRIVRAITITAHDDEEMLVSFLTELIFIAEQEGLGFDQMELLVRDNLLMASLVGAQICEQKKEIKAVTYHNLEILQDGNGYRAKIVFDV